MIHTNIVPSQCWSSAEQRFHAAQRREDEFYARHMTSEEALNRPALCRAADVLIELRCQAEDVLMALPSVSFDALGLKLRIAIDPATGDIRRPDWALALKQEIIIRYYHAFD